MTTAIKKEAKQAATSLAEHVAGFPAEGVRIPGQIECVSVPTMGARDDPVSVVVEKDAGRLQLVCHSRLSLLSCGGRMGTLSCLLIGISASHHEAVASKTPGGVVLSKAMSSWEQDSCRAPALKRAARVLSYARMWGVLATDTVYAETVFPHYCGLSS
jgi:hypothetical protein